MTKNYKSISGAKSKPDKPRAPREDPNTLQSRAIARFIDLIGEGEIEGLVNGEHSIYLDGIPIQEAVLEDALDDKNFQGAITDFQPGLPDHIQQKEYPATESVISVDIQVTQTAGPIERVITDTDTDDVLVTFTVPALLEVKPSTGDVVKTDLSWSITIKPSNSASFLPVKTISLNKEKCTSAYQLDYRITRLDDNYGPGPWIIRVTRLTADSDTANLQNELYWASYTQIINRRLIYPDSALCYVELNAQEYGSRVPSRFYEVYGKKIWLPSNYTPTQSAGKYGQGGTYDGVWDGELTKYSFSANPAWIYFDLLTDNRYGLGLDPDYVDKISLYSIGVYCDEQITNNEGGLEPRFTFNGVIQNRQDAINVLNQLASAFRAMPYWGGGKASLSQDKPADPVKLVTAANVIDGDFMYRGSSIKDRYTVANVSWNDPDNYYKLTVETVNDNEGIRRYGYRPLDTVAFGCTSRGQAYRFGKWALYTSLYQTETLTYRASWDHADVLPGDIIEVLDPHYANKRTGGRLVSSVPFGVAMVIDDGIILEVGQTYSIAVTLPDGSIEEKAITTPSDGNEHTGITVGSPFSDTPQNGSVWIITASNLSPRQFRVVNNQEVEPNIFEITAVFHDPDKYAYVEDGQKFDPAPISKVPDATKPITAPTNLNAEEYTYEDTESSSASDRKFGVILSWTHTRDTRFQEYEIQWKLSTGSYSDNETLISSSPSVDIKPVVAGIYNFRVHAVGLGLNSTWLTLSNFEVLADPDVPPDITGLQVTLGTDSTTFSGKDCNITWDALVLTTDTTSPIVYDGTSVIPVSAAPFDSILTKIKDYQIEVLTIDDVHLRYAWTTDNFWIYTIGMNTDDLSIPSRFLKFKVWARDIYDQLSANAATLVVSNPAPTMAGSIPTITPLFNGLKIDWSSIVPADNDLLKYDVLLDTSNPPTTVVATVSVNTTYWIETGLDPDTTYRARIRPYDEFGVGTISSTDSGEPLYLPQESIEGELTDRLIMSDSLDTTSTILAEVYNTVTDTGNGVIYNSGGWIQYKFPIEQLQDRVHVWFNNASVNCYIAISSDLTNWTYLKAEADHTLDSDGRLLEATNQADAQTNYWTADAGVGNINTALYPNRITGIFARIYFVSNSVEVNELIFVDQVIAEQITTRNLAAISADLGTIQAGILQSQNLSGTEGVYIDLNDEIIKMGGLSDPNFSWDGTSSELSVTGSVFVTGGSWSHPDDGTQLDGSVLYSESQIVLGEGGRATFGDQNVVIDTAGDKGSIIIAPDGGPDGQNFCELTDGELVFRYWDGLQHIVYNPISRIETGIANNDTVVNIPGIFKEQPSIILFPNIMPVYNKDYVTQSQSFRLEAIDLEEYATDQWRFTAQSQLELSDGANSVIIEETVTQSSGSRNDWVSAFNSAEYTLVANTRNVNLEFRVSGETWRSFSYIIGGGKDEPGTVAYYNYTAPEIFNVRFYYKLAVSGWAYKERTNVSGGITLTLSTGTQVEDIEKIYVRLIHVGTGSEVRYSGNRGEGTKQTIFVNKYTSDQTTATVLTEGKVTWIALGR